MVLILKSLDICKSYEIFIEWINQNSELLNLITPRGIYRDSYALIEFIKYKSVDEVKRYYERFGYTLALGYTFAMTDIHLENIVANRGSVRKMRIYNVKSIFPAYTRGLQTFVSICNLLCFFF